MEDLQIARELSTGDKLKKYLPYILSGLALTAIGMETFNVTDFLKGNLLNDSNEETFNKLAADQAWMAFGRDDFFKPLIWDLPGVDKTDEGKELVSILDSDGDGLSDELEQIIGSNPNAADSDSDSIPDMMEMFDKNNLSSIYKYKFEQNGINEPSDLLVMIQNINSIEQVQKLTDGFVTTSADVRVALGISDISDIILDSDADGIPDFKDEDSNNNGTKDGAELIEITRSYNPEEIFERILPDGLNFEGFDNLSMDRKLQALGIEKLEDLIDLMFSFTDMNGNNVWDWAEQGDSENNS